MASEPITIFSHTADPEAVLAVVQEVVPNAKVTYANGDWSEITVTFKRGFLSRGLTLTLSHDVDYYSGDSWQQQKAGMHGYFSRFEMDDQRRAEVNATIASFDFAIGTVATQDFIDDDPRLELISRIVHELQGCMFLPSGLRDSAGRRLCAPDGSYDADAVFPPRPTESLADVDDENDEDDDDLYDIAPPDATAVAKRTLVLAAVAARGSLEIETEGKADHPAAAMQPELGQWIDDLGLREECEEDEWRRIITPIGELNERDLINSMWRIESLGVLAWALHLYDLPRYDTLVDVGALLRSVALLETADARDLIAAAELRSPDELWQYASETLAFHWRLRDFGINPVAMNYRTFGDTCWFGPIAMDWAEFGLDDDLALDGVSISQADEEVVSRVTSVAMERHTAINWLRGSSVIYSETDTST